MHGGATPRLEDAAGQMAELLGDEGRALGGDRSCPEIAAHLLGEDAHRRRPPSGCPGTGPCRRWCSASAARYRRSRRRRHGRCPSPAGPRRSRRSPCRACAERSARDESDGGRRARSAPAAPRRREARIMRRGRARTPPFRHDGIEIVGAGDRAGREEMGGQGRGLIHVSSHRRRRTRRRHDAADAPSGA